MTSRPVALITGATRGIGAATARVLAPTHELLLGGRDAAALDALASELPAARPWPVELTDPAALAEATAELSELDVLVHSAGTVLLADLDATSAEQWRQMLELNVVAVAELTRLLLPALRVRRGQVVLINSGQGINVSGGWGAYAASKFALRAYADVLRMEEAANGLRVTTVYPGRTDTAMQREVFAAEGREYEAKGLLRPESVAEAVRGAVLATPDAHQTELVIRPAP
ncbi:NADP-dependent 3-hydroxy acid dehydrogenase YdfG [Tamaricihabitans halophyticus]|uniref:NADP-dependent 3-hydroxy acid dehydrogenase YdfG n=1 Tax=Tamaricihabitans halophyticus TaxID=1262583 RepID=A0A4R2R6B0_9PSEU|nr:SDR family oxidoreductase [Tamaricihabitans halophyticus]TCP57368.1 NADP-dependent 3-hydroxy acid dehydrogenase YdfG [Tamaricihabitans halophyticus]